MSGGQLLRIDLVLSIYDLEEIRKPANAFRVSQHQNAVRIESVMEDWHDLLLQNRVHIDQHVPATDQVHVGKWRVGKDVVASENTHLPNRLADSVSTFHSGEKPPQALR